MIGNNKDSEESQKVVNEVVFLENDVELIEMDDYLKEVEGGEEDVKIEEDEEENQKDIKKAISEKNDVELIEMDDYLKEAKLSHILNNKKEFL